ncbi:MAG: DUF4926 domain-containing protein, partial [Bacteroidota bacterium]
KDLKNLKTGDMGTIVMIHKDPQGYEVEFFSASGATIAVESLSPEMIRPLKKSDILAGLYESLLWCPCLQFLDFLNLLQVQHSLILS